MEEENTPLSERELEIMRLVATGATNRQIAHTLNISVNTVKVHLRNIFDKLTVQSRTEATMALVRAGLIATEAGQAAGDSSPTSSEPPEAVAPAAATEGTNRNRPVFLLLVAGVAILAGILAWNQGFAWSVSAPVTKTAVQVSPTRWQSEPSLDLPRFGMGVVAYRGRIFVLAGGTTTPGQAGETVGVTGRSAALDPATSSWTDLPHKPTPVQDVQAAALEGRLLVPGGQLASGAITTTVEAFDLATETWQRMPDLPAPRSRYALAVLEGRLILFGGWDGTAVQSSVLEYDSDAGAWHELTPLPTARADMACAVIEDSAYLLGGTDGQQPLSEAIAYQINAEDARSGPWSRLRDLPAPRAGASAVAIARSIYLIGGGKNLPGIRYDLTSETWMPLSSPASTPWYGMGVATVDDRLYVLGGLMDEPVGDVWSYTALYRYFLPQGAYRR